MTLPRLYATGSCLGTWTTVDWLEISGCAVKLATPVNIPVMLVISLIILLVFADKIPASEKGTQALSTNFQVEDEFASVRNNPDLKARKKRMLKRSKKLWKHAAVIYKMDPTMGCPMSKECQVVFEAMKEFVTKTCVRFKEWTGEANYVLIVESSNLIGGGLAYVGMKGGRQNLAVKPGCWKKGLLMHELAHTLSLWDEVTRPDRDNYVDLFTKNILPEMLWAFAPVDRRRINLLGQPYDYKSIMNYSETAFSKDPSKLYTVRAKNGRKMIHASEKDHISKGDVQRVRDLYRCNGSALTTGGYLECKLNVKISRVDHIGSINFHGLSDLDSKRGPEGCIKFMYQFEGVQERSLALELLRMGLKTTFDDKSVDAISIWSGINFGSANWSRAVVPIDVSTPFALQFKFKLLEESNRGSVKVDNLEVRYTACDHPSHATLFGSKVTQLKSLSIKSMKSFKYMKPPSLGSFRSSVVGSSSSNLSKNPSSKAGWLRSLPSRVFKSKKSQSLGSSRYSFGSFSSKRSGVSTPDIPKLSIEK